MKRVTLLVAGVVFALASQVRAAPVTFFGEDLGLGEITRLPSHPNSDAAHTSFINNLVGVGTEDFESFADGTSAPLLLNFPGSSGSITATLTGSGAIHTVSSGAFAGRYPTSGDNYWEVSGSFGITFSDPVAAFGFYGIDIGDFGGQVTATTAGGLNMVFNVPNTINGAGGGVLFWGVIDASNTFTSVTFGNTAPGTDIFAFDDMTIGDPGQVHLAPEPGMLALLLAGFGLVGLRRRRKV